MRASPANLEMVYGSSQKVLRFFRSHLWFCSFTALQREQEAAPCMHTVKRYPQSYWVRTLVARSVCVDDLLIRVQAWAPTVCAAAGFQGPTGPGLGLDPTPTKRTVFAQPVRELLV